MSEAMRLRSFYLPNAMYEDLRGIANRSDYNISDHVRAALESYIQAAHEQEAAGAVQVEATVEPVMPIELEAAANG